MRLARPVRAEHADAIAVPDLGIEGSHEPGELEPGGDDGPFARAGTSQAHVEVLCRWPLLGRACLLEPAQPCLRGLIPRREAVVRRCLHLEGRHERAQLLVLLVPTPAQLVEPVHAVRARLVIGREAAAMHPRGGSGATRLQRDQPVGGARQELAIVGYEKHRLRGPPQLLLEPALRGDVEVIVRLVQQQHLVGASQQRLECQALLLAARERCELPVVRTFEGHTEGCRRALIPHRLVLVATGIRVLRNGRRVRHLDVVLVALDERVLGRLEGFRRRPDPPRGDAHQQLVHRLPGAAVSDELIHDAESAIDGHDAVVGLLITADDAQQGGLPGAVRSDQRAGGAGPHPERRLVEKRSAVGERQRDCGDIDVAHCARPSFRPRAASRPGYQSTTGAVDPRSPGLVFGDRRGPTLSEQRFCDWCSLELRPHQGLGFFTREAPFIVASRSTRRSVHT
ncbi:hypothetical protein RS85_01089 [Microbacterium sp. SA39]|nr:hypothetical protein RS85_01089 [Microbacterium sp. SA39]